MEICCWSKKTSKFIDDDIDISSDDSNRENFDQGNSNEEKNIYNFFLEKYKKVLFFRLCKFPPEQEKLVLGKI